MKKFSFCGLDFGTSNSSLGIINHNAPYLIPLEEDKDTIPSAVFFNIDDDERNPIPYFGKQAIKQYSDGYSGRLIRSFKSLLGTSLINDKTQIGQKNISFEDIISVFVKHIKTQAQKHCDFELESVVCGRPVFFIDNNPLLLP
jgi:hypothetical chaperone protein